MQSRCGIVILSYTDQAAGDTVACLDSLVGALKHSAFEVVVVAIQADGTRFTNHPLHPTVLTSEQNLGFTGGNNWGAREAIRLGCERIVFLNNDTTVDAHFLTPLLKRLSRTTVGLVVPKIYFTPGREFHHDAYSNEERGRVLWYAGGIIDWQNVYATHRGVDEVDHGQFDVAEKTDFATGCCVAMTCETFEKTGGFDERYFLYMEDLDLSLRVLKMGMSIWYEPESVVWHSNAGSTGGAGSQTHVYYQTRNRWLFGMRFAPVRTQAALLREALKKLIGGLAVEKQALRDAFGGRYGQQ